MSNIRNRIKELRKEYGYTQESLANALGLNAKSSIANYENGSNAPSDEIKLKMCNLFNCSMDYLMGKTNIKNVDDFYKQIDDNIKKYYYDDYLNQLLAVGISREDAILIINSYFKTPPYLTLIEHTNDFAKEQFKFLDEILSKYSVSICKKVLSIIKNFLKIKEKIISEIINQATKKIQLTDNQNYKLYNIPIIGKITAGQPIEAKEYLEGYLPVDPNIYGLSTSEDLFYLRVSGESMNLKVHNGDYALIHKQDFAENGDIIVAIVNSDDEATLKKYKRLNDQFVLLEPMSTDPSIEAITVDLKNTKFQIIGKAIGQFGKF